MTANGRQNVGFLLQVPDGFRAGERLSALLFPLAALRAFIATSATSATGVCRELRGGLHGTRGWATVFTTCSRTEWCRSTAPSPMPRRPDGTRCSRPIWRTMIGRRSCAMHRTGSRSSMRIPARTRTRDGAATCLRSIEFALHHLGEGEALSPDETLVIVAGNSNGGGAARCGQADERGLIDGIVAAQPQVQLTADDRVSVTRGGRTLEGSGRPLLDYFTFALIHQPCGALALPDAPWADRVTFARERCESRLKPGLPRPTLLRMRRRHRSPPCATTDGSLNPTCCTPRIMSSRRRPRR